MPKETIRGEGFDVEIAWGRDQAHVQLATVMKPPETPNSPDGLGVLLEGWSPDERIRARGLYATLDQRHAINEIIRVLKRARDQAFGRDE